MKQLILVGNQKVKFQDTETIISLTLVADGNTVTIDSTKTYSVKIKNGTGYVKSITATPDMVNNMVTFSTSGFDGLPVDSYFIELWVIDTNGQTIYPSDSFIEVDITANATGVQGQVVPAITLQEFEDRFNTLQSDLETMVSTLIGPTGATGNGISGVTTQYQLSSSGSSVPTGTWVDSPVTPTDALPYMWTRNVTTYTDKSTSTSYNISVKGTQGNNFTIQGSTSSIAGLPSTGTDGEGYMVGTELYVWTNGKWNDIVDMKGVQGDQGIQGIQGIKGDTGTGISSVTTEYELSNQGTEVPSTGWSTTIPTATNDLPYLWTRVTITFTDSTQNVVYFTSSKGDKGDTGDKGDKGDTGANLAVKGAVDSATDLPSSGNSEGDAYMVGTNLYVYTSGDWKNCGPIVAENTVLYNADGSLNVNGTNYNYVQDLRNGKIQYNDGTKNIELTPVDSQQEAEDILSARNYTDTSISSLSTSVDTKLSSKANSTDLTTGLSTKVTDNHDGTEQLNGVQVQPYNKLSDTIGSRNYALNTENLSAVCDGSSNQYVLKIPVNHDIFGNPNVIISYDAVVTNYTSGTFLRLKHSDIDGNYHTMSDSADSNNIAANGNYHIVYHGSFPSQTTTLDTLSFSTDLDATVTIKNFMLTIGSTQASYLSAPEDKVNVSDMRKPASDVAGIDEVNQQLDKKVVDNKDGTEQLNGVQVQPFNKLSDTIGGRNLIKDSEQEFAGKAYDFHDYNLASLTELTPGKTYTVSYSAKVDDKAVNCNQHVFVDVFTPSWSWYVQTNVLPISTDYQRGTYTFTIPEGQTGVNCISAYLSHPVINGNFDPSSDKSDAAGTGYIKELKLEEGSIATDWTPAPEDKVNVSDMRKPASDVAGIEEVNAKQDAIGYTPADNATVVHNTGNEEITGTKTFDTAPIDKTTGNPYITKDGVPAVPSTLADTTKLANFTAGLQSNGNEVVTTNQVSANIVQTIDPGTDLFTIKQAGIYRSVWGNQNTLKNFPSPDGSATIIYSGSGNTDNGIQITVIDSWGSVFVSHWQGAASTPGYSAWQNVSSIANPTQDTNFTGKLQKAGIDVATATDVSNAVNTATANMGKFSLATDETDASTKSSSDPSTFYYWSD